ncbi:MAG: hypothetical protein ACT4PU_01040 [Planctomycetota bacterium]
MSASHSRTLSDARRQRLRALLAGRGHALLQAPKNPYVDFEVRTEGRSIFTAYTSGKFVSTVRAGDAEGALVEAAIAELCGETGGDAGGAQPRGPQGAEPAEPGLAPAAHRQSPSGQLMHGTSPGLVQLIGLDETGTGELLGSAVVGGALLPLALVPALERCIGHVDTKSSRAASGWEDLGEQLAGLRAQGLRGATLAIPNRLFDAWSKNGLLDLAYVRLVGDLLAEHGPGSLTGLEIVIDDYGIGPLLSRAVAVWRGRGASVLVQTKADDRHLAPRAASVLARSQRSREMQGLIAEVDDGPLGSGNAGHRDTLAWMRRRARTSPEWPSFVKASFRTARLMRGLPETGEKARLPALHQLLDDEAAQALLSGTLDLRQASLRDAAGKPFRALRLSAEGRLLEPAPPCPAFELLPMLCGGIVLDSTPRRRARFSELLATALVREGGLLSGWRVLVGPEEDVDDPLLVALARAHRAGIVCVVPTAESAPAKRAVRHAGVLLAPARSGLTLTLPD